MALMKVDFFSKSLMRTVTFNAIIPVDKEPMPGNEVIKNKKYKTLYLLHGVFGNYTDWILNTRIALWAQERDLAVIMPSGENKFYVDNEKSMEKFSEFVGCELVEFTRDLLPLSKQREDTYIAGLSMGGYGACVTGLRFNDTFGYIGMLSAALILESAHLASDDDPILYRRKSYYESVFGDISKIDGSEKDYKALITNLKESNANIPNIYQVCGEQDFLIEQNRDYYKYLQENSIDVFYEEWEGVHDWKFWDEAIFKFIEYLPLDDKNDGIHSGNVQ